MHRPSNLNLRALAGALELFASARHPEPTVEELRALVARIESTPIHDVAPVLPPRQTAEDQLGRERVMSVLRDYEAGASANSLASEYGIAAASIMRLVRKHGLVVHDRAPDAELIAQAASIYRDGLSLQRVANEVGIPKASLRKALLKVGVELRPGPH